MKAEMARSPHPALAWRLPGSPLVGLRTAQHLADLISTQLSSMSTQLQSCHWHAVLNTGSFSHGGINTPSPAMSWLMCAASIGFRPTFWVS